MLAAFREGLKQLGFAEGQNVAIEYRWANDQYDRLLELAADLVRRRVAVIATSGTPAALAANAATATIPIVFNIGIDPVRIGLVASFNRPGGNATGVSTMNNELTGKRLQWLHELVPGATRFAMLHDSTAAVFQSVIAEAQAAALFVRADQVLQNRHQQIVELAARHRVPTIYANHEAVAAGGLMSYGPLRADNSRLLGSYAGRILKGEKPADMPVLQPTKVELHINMQTAKALGLTVPITLLGRADKVID